MNAAIISLILSIAIETGVPPYFALAIALEENSSLNPVAVNANRDGTFDRGVMQLNSSWFKGDWQDPETNIRAGCRHIKTLLDKGLNHWQAAIAYNCGYARLLAGPPDASIEYANRIFSRWQELQLNKGVTNGK